MLTFNAILRHEGLDPKGVRLVRHQDTRRPGRPTPYNLWRAGDGRLETYQQIQRRSVFAKGNLLASFVATPTNETLFIGLYSVDGVGPVPPGVTDPIAGDQDLSGMNFYDIHRDDRLVDYAGHLIIEWGAGFRAWVQRAELQHRGKKPYQVTVLEVVNSDVGIEAVEEAWKKRLMSREFGLNKN